MSATGDLLRQLHDIESIKQLKASYFRLLDTKQWDDWGQVFAPDAVLEVPEAGQVLRGRSEIVASVSRSLADARTVHHGYTPEIEVDGDRARGTWARSDHVEWSGADGVPAGIRGQGHYLEEYVRVDERWRIARSHLRRLRVDPISG